jgi:hypothetical protein
MRTVSDLHRTLDAHAADVSFDPGLVAGARSRGLRLRRRRRLLLSGTATALAILAGAVSFLRPTAPEPDAVAQAPYRSAGQLSVAIAEGSPFRIIRQTGEAGKQTAWIRNIGDLTAKLPGEDDENFGGNAEIFDPGVYDPTELRKGQKVTVAGHDAWFDPTGMPIVGWEDPSGAWVVLTGSSRPEAVEVAADIRLVTPEAPRTPYRIGWIPGGRAPSHVRYEMGAATIEFGPRRELKVQALPSTDPDWKTIQPGLPEPTTIGSATVWRMDQPNGMFTGENGSNIAMRYWDCLIYVTVADRTEIPFAEVTRMLESMTVTSCADQDNWQPFR